MVLRTTAILTDFLSVVGSVQLFQNMISFSPLVVLARDPTPFHVLSPNEVLFEHDHSMHCNQMRKTEELFGPAHVLRIALIFSSPSVRIGIPFRSIESGNS